MLTKNVASASSVPRCSTAPRPPMGPTIAVLIPVRDAMPWLPLAVRDALVQRGVAVEVVVVDDGSVDGSAQWLRGLCDALGGARAHCDPQLGADGAGTAENLPAYAIAGAATAGDAHRTNPAHTLPSMRKRPPPPPAASAAAAAKAPVPAPAVAAAVADVDLTTLSKRKRRRVEKKRARVEAKARARLLREANEAAAAAAAAAPIVAEAPPLSTAEVAACVRAAIDRGDANPQLTVVRSSGVGQGAALETALRTSSASLIAHNEADDTYGPWRLHALWRALEEATAGPGPASTTTTTGSSDCPESESTVRHLDAVFSPTRLSGAARYRTEGMGRYVEWQNSLTTTATIAAARFIELPSLHQTGLYRRDSLLRCAALDPTSTSAWGEAPVVYRDLPQWPVDLDFTLRWFASGARAVKLEAKSDAGAQSMYYWRQHSRNGTRWQGRCALDALRACKAHYIATGEGAPPAAVEVWSCGATLDAWVAALAAAGVVVARAVRWRPGSDEVLPSDTEDIGDKDADRTVATEQRRVRLFAFGTPKARRKVRTALGRRWCPESDWFVA